MPLIDGVKKVCDRLAPTGWDELLLRHGLDIRPPKTVQELERELTNELTNIDRGMPGF
jgi:hypothetical protein